MCDYFSFKCFDSKLWPFWLLTCSSVVSVSTPMETAISARPERHLSWAWPTQRRAMLLQMEPEDWQIEPPTPTQTVTELERDNKKRKRKKKKRKQGEKKRRRHKHTKPQVSLGQPANLLLANLATLPVPHTPTLPPYHPTTTTLKPLKYLLHKGSLLKKKKQEYLSHLGYVFLPFVKFVTFFTVLNPFTLAVFFFMLISPVVFALLGFTAISFILKPVMSLLFAVKRRVGSTAARRRPPRKRPAPRPITIHKHYYQQPRPYPVPLAHRSDSGPPATTPRAIYNPLLPQVRHQLRLQAAHTH